MRNTWLSRCSDLVALKSIPRLLVGSLLLSCTASVALPAKTVVDYFVAMPPRAHGLSFADGRAPTARQMRSYLRTVDEKNGFLEAEASDERETRMVAALFRRKSASPLLAVTFETDFFRLAVFDVADWTDVTAKVVPPISPAFVNQRIREIDSRPVSTRPKDYTDRASESPVVYRLPRTGTTIRAVCGLAEKQLHDKPLFSLRFDGARFLLSKP